MSEIYLQDRFIDPATQHSAGLLRQRRDSLELRLHALRSEFQKRTRGILPSTEDEIEELFDLIKNLTEERDLINAKLMGLDKITKRYDPEPGKPIQTGISTGSGRSYWKNNTGSAKPRGD